MITSKPKKLKPKHKSTFGLNFRKLWQLRYRGYAVIVILLITPLVFSSDKNVPEDVPITGLGYSVTDHNWLVSWLKKSPIQAFAQNKINRPTKYIVKGDDVFVYDEFGNLLAKLSLLKDKVDLDELARFPFVTIINQGVSVATGEGKPEVVEPEPQPINQLANLKVNPQISSLLIYDKYKIKAPVIWTSLNDLYETKSDGSLDLSKARDTGGVNTPVQQKLKDGIVHLAYTELPGEIGNSYIVGHSSNYSYIQSAYNTIFRPIQERSAPGEEFTIYDQIGREMKFKVFEAKKIEENDYQEAYKKFDLRRVVTLQTSILTWKNGSYQATHRWITRGELLNPDTNQPYPS